MAKYLEIVFKGYKRRPSKAPSIKKAITVVPSIKKTTVAPAPSFLGTSLPKLPSIDEVASGIGEHVAKPFKFINGLLGIYI